MFCITLFITFDKTNGTMQEQSDILEPTMYIQLKRHTHSHNVKLCPCSHGISSACDVDCEHAEQLSKSLISREHDETDQSAFPNGFN